jgi:hypothetical protein
LFYSIESDLILIVAFNTEIIKVKATGLFRVLGQVFDKEHVGCPGDTRGSQQHLPPDQAKEVNSDR